MTEFVDAVGAVSVGAGEAAGGARPERPEWGSQPVEPPPTTCAFPPADQADETGVVALGGDLEPGTLLTAYRSGLFPMPYGRRGELLWWSPDPRAVIPLDGLRVSRSLRRSCRRYEVRVDTAFEAVVEACADPRRPDGWISPAIHRAYVRLHELGWAHSVETWDPETGRLVGGLYGVAIGGLFAGESMFHHATDASKVALVGLVSLLAEDEGVGGPGGASVGGPADRAGRAGAGGPSGGAGAGSGRAVGGGAGNGRGRLLDVQWQTPHLARLGAIEIPRRRYLDRVRGAVRLPLPRAFRPSPPLI